GGINGINPVAFLYKPSFLVTDSANLRGITRVATGWEAAVKARFGQGGFFSGGIASGRTVTDSCAFKASPNVTGANVFTLQTSESDFCLITPPWGADTQVKFTAGYTLPKGFQTSV